MCIDGTDRPRYMLTVLEGGIYDALLMVYCAVLGLHCVVLSPAYRINV